MPTQKEAAQNMEETKTKEEGKETNAIALFSYLGILLVIPLLVAKDDPFVKFHVKQGLVFLIFTILFGWIPFVGWIAVIVLGILGIVNVFNGKKEELPIIGQFGKKFNF